jgi:hypothetical protein
MVIPVVLNTFISSTGGLAGGRVVLSQNMPIQTGSELLPSSNWIQTLAPTGGRAKKPTSEPP